MEIAAQGRAAGVRFGVKSVLVKDRVEQKSQEKRKNECSGESKKAPQAKTHCGVSNRRMKMMRRTDNDQNLGGSFGGVYGVSPSP